MTKFLSTEDGEFNGNSHEEPCSHPWAYQDQNGVPSCSACGEDWSNVMHPMTEATLMPCPFCAGEAERQDVPAIDGDDNGGGSYIECSKCGACTQLHFDRKENLLDSWNRRTWHQSEIDQFGDALFRFLGESNHKVSPWSQGSEPWEYWSRGEIEQALADILNPTRSA